MILCDQPTIGFSNINELSILITAVGYIVVFMALASLVIIIGRIATVQGFYVRLKLRRRKKTEDPVNIKPEPSISADANAAICTALYLYFTELHDEEKYVMTVKKVSRTYSPWSSKIYGIMNLTKNG
jgi:hypothetical protein